MVALREIKGDEEIAEMEAALAVTRDMHIAAMRHAKPGVMEYEVVGEMEGIMRRRDWQLAYPSIFSRRGEVLHNHHHDNRLESGDLALNDTGCTSGGGYASDITRTFPVGGKFSPRQRELYNIVLDMQLAAIEAMKPGVRYLDVHKLSARLMVERMSALGFFRGDANAIVESGAYAIAFPTASAIRSAWTCTIWKAWAKTWSAMARTPSAARCSAWATCAWASRCWPAWW